MKEIPSRLLPVLLMGAQAAVWPGLALLRGESVEGSALLATALVIGVAGAALSLRTQRPVHALAVLTAVCAVGGTAARQGGFDVLGTAGMGVALYSVARHRDAPTAWISAVTLAVWQVQWDVPLHQAGGVAGGGAADLVLTVAVYALALGTGLSQRRWERARTRFASRLDLAERERRRLPTAERDRLARELHDVSAHQLTAVVVTVEAAQKLGDRQPELAAEAMDFAAHTGREVRDTLGRTPTTPTTASEPESGHGAPRLEELAAGFRRLGQPVTVEGMPQTLTASVAEAVYGVVREALTNALRHAPGSSVRVCCTDSGERVELVVENDAPGEPSEERPGDAPEGPAADRTAGTVSGLGGGRGLAGLRERARAAEGNLTAGPSEGGGWRVRAEFPGSGAAQVAGGRGRGLSRYRRAQLVVAAAVCVNPVLPILNSVNWSGPPGAEPGAGSLLALLAGAQTLPLLGLRRAPWTVLCAVLALAVLWPLTGTPDGHPLSVGVPLAVSAVLTAVAVCGVAAHAGTGPNTSRTGPNTWFTVPLAAGWHAALAALAVAIGGTEGPVLLWVAGTAAVGAAVSAGARQFGHGRRRGHARLAGERQAALTASVTTGVAQAHAERQRIVSGLRESVLERVGQLVDRAEAGQLSQVAVEARNALTAMRELLGVLRSREAAAERTAEPGTEALDLLCQQHCAMGREVALEGLDRVPEQLPRAADLAAFRMVETALGAEDTGPARILLDHADGRLTIDISGAPGAVRGAARQRLEAQRQAVGAVLTSAPSGAVRISLPTEPGGTPATEPPAAPGRTPAEEGTSSRSV